MCEAIFHSPDASSDITEEVRFRESDFCYRADFDIRPSNTQFLPRHPNRNDYYFVLTLNGFTV